MAAPLKKEIQALLSKQNLTGDEAGRLMILDLISAYKNLADGGEGIGILTDAEKTDIVNSLVFPDEIQRFNDYRGLHDYLTSAPVIAESYAKTYEVYHLKMLHLLSNMKRAEEENALLKLRPIVMTKKQYELFHQSGIPMPAGGIAVLQSIPSLKYGIDEDGMYYEPEPEYRRDYMAENVLQKHTDFINEALDGMKDMLAECLARKKALELVASYTKIPQIKMLIMPVGGESLELLNGFMFVIIKKLLRDNEKAVIELQSKLSALFVPIDLAALEPTPQAVKKARRSLNFYVIKNSSEAFVASLKREWRNDC